VFLLFLLHFKNIQSSRWMTQVDDNATIHQVFKSQSSAFGVKRRRRSRSGELGEHL